MKYLIKINGKFKNFIKCILFCLNIWINIENSNKCLIEKMTENDIEKLKQQLKKARDEISNLR